jgi:hypothetical protein
MFSMNIALIFSCRICRMIAPTSPAEGSASVLTPTGAMKRIP